MDVVANKEVLTNFFRSCAGKNQMEMEEWLVHDGIDLLSIDPGRLFILLDTASRQENLFFFQQAAQWVAEEELGLSGELQKHFMRALQLQKEESFAECIFEDDKELIEWHKQCRLFLNRYTLSVKQVPYYPAQKDVQRQKRQEGEVAFFSMGPNWEEWKEVLSVYQEEPCVVCFIDSYSLLHSLQFPGVLDFLFSDSHGWCVLDVYPNVQIAEQPFLRGLSGELNGCSEDQELALGWQQAIDAFPGQYWMQTEEADALYRVMKRKHRRHTLEYFGKERWGACYSVWRNEDWVDPFKSIPEMECSLYAPDLDPLPVMLAQCYSTGVIQERSLGTPLRVAHCLQYLIDGGHAPSRRIREVVLGYDRKQFQPYVYMVEQNIARSSSYPLAVVSTPSAERASESFRLFEEGGIPTEVTPHFLEWEATAEWLYRSMERDRIDIAVFHSENGITALANKKLSHIPTVFIEHGRMPHIRSHYDLVIVTDQREADVFAKYAPEYPGEIKENCVAMPVESRGRIEREAWGLSSELFLMTTLSNHLANRLSDKMCWVISEVLRRYPHAVYAPIGSLGDIGRVEDIFSYYGVREQVCFLGSHHNPHPFLSLMDVYLNEFPVGSGLACVDALAASLPIVTMDYSEGYIQGRHGASYFGSQYGIGSCSPQDYLDRVCALVENRTLYREWQEQAKKQYKKHSDISRYMYTHQEYLRECVKRFYAR